MKVVGLGELCPRPMPFRQPFPTPEINQGINITVGVLFGNNAPDVRAMQLEIIGVGAEFQG